jgi:hypothetical protein
LKIDQITAAFVDKLRKSSGATVALMGEPLLIDWNLAIESDDSTHPHNGTRCFVSQHLLRSTDELITRSRNDDEESLLKSLIGLRDPTFCQEINGISDATDRANQWERSYPIILRPIGSAFDTFLMSLRRN